MEESKINNLDSIRKRIGKRLKKKRLDNNLTAENLGFKIDVSKSMISKIENGHYMPSIELLNKLSAALNVSISYFIQENLIEPDEDQKDKGLEAIYILDELKDEGITIEEIKQIYEILKVTKRIK